MFVIGQNVLINPKWEKEFPNCDNHGISTWKKYIGTIYKITEITGSMSYILNNSPYFWPDYMLIPVDKKIIKYYLQRRINENR